MVPSKFSHAEVMGELEQFFEEPEGEKKSMGGESLLAGAANPVTGLWAR